MYESGTEIKNFFYYSKSTVKINVIQPHDSRSLRPYSLLADESIDDKLSFKVPFDFSDSLSKYLFKSRHALVNNQLHIFGGYYEQSQTYGHRVIN